MPRYGALSEQKRSGLHLGRSCAHTGTRQARSRTEHPARGDGNRSPLLFCEGFASLLIGSLGIKFANHGHNIESGPVAGTPHQTWKGHLSPFNCVQRIVYSAGANMPDFGMAFFGTPDTTVYATVLRFQISCLKQHNTYQLVRMLFTSTLEMFDHACRKKKTL